MTKAIQLSFPEKNIKGAITVKNQIAVLWLSDPAVTFKLFEMEKEAGNKNIKWDTNKKMLIEFHKNKRENAVIQHYEKKLTEYNKQLGLGIK